jgi:uncharacterized protein with HEPN domain
MSRKIEGYPAGLDESRFLESTLIQDAVIRNFEVIGEATKNLDKRFCDRNPEIEWKKIAGL